VGNYPLTVGIPIRQGIPGEVRIRRGGFRVTREYDSPVRVPELVLNCVAFIGEVAHKNPDGSVDGDLHATGFFVSVPLTEERNPRAVYFVTARHVAKDLQGRELYLLVNKTGGGVTHIRHFGGNTMLVHPTDPTADVALIQIGFQGDADIGSVGVEEFGTPERLRYLNIGIGDEVQSTGLFTPVAGEKRNIPIVRTGNLAMMPQEQIQTELGFADVYLVEARSIGGLSGSPVFVRPTINYKLPPEMVHGDVKNAYWCGHGATLLGLMHGHWDIKESEMNKAYFTHDGKQGVNLGIAIVVPAIKILETLNRPELEEARQDMKDKLRKRMVPGLDSAKPKNNELEPQFTSADFEAALKKVSRKLQTN
jgi:hypothetical protein